MVLEGLAEKSIFISKIEGGKNKVKMKISSVAIGIVYSTKNGIRVTNEGIY